MVGEDAVDGSGVADAEPVEDVIDGAVAAVADAAAENVGEKVDAEVDEAVGDLADAEVAVETNDERGGGAAAVCLQ